jgi:H+/gluconate symporter-like permease
MSFAQILALIAKLFGFYQSSATGGAATAVAKIAPTVATIEEVAPLL